MQRALAPLAALAFALTAGCSSCSKDGSSGTTGGATSSTTGALAVTAPPASASASAPSSGGPMGTATIKGVVNFTGKPLEMKVPKGRARAEHCKTKPIKHNALVVADGKLADVIVRIASDGIKGEYKAPAKPVEVDQVDCNYTPRIQGAMVGQELDIKNADPVLHNVRAFKGNATWFVQSQPKGSIAVNKTIEDASMIKLVSDLHPWMRSFVIVLPHPFFAVSGADGAFAIEKVPAGKYTVEAWHPRYGQKTAEVEVADGKPVEVTFSYDGTEQEPFENKDELKDLF